MKQHFVELFVYIFHCFTNHAVHLEGRERFIRKNRDENVEMDEANKED